MFQRACCWLAVLESVPTPLQAVLCGAAAQAAATAEPRRGPGAEWPCASCTLLNAGDAATCVVCGQPRAREVLPRRRQRPPHAACACTLLRCCVAALSAGGSPQRAWAGSIASGFASAQYPRGTVGPAEAHRSSACCMCERAAAVQHRAGCMRRPAGAMCLAALCRACCACCAVAAALPAGARSGREGLCCAACAATPAPWRLRRGCAPWRARRPLPAGVRRIYCFAVPRTLLHLRLAAQTGVAASFLAAASSAGAGSGPSLSAERAGGPGCAAPARAAEGVLAAGGVAGAATEEAERERRLVDALARVRQQAGARRCIEALAGYVGGVLRAPDSNKQRNISTRGRAFAEGVGAVPGGREFLEARPRGERAACCCLRAAAAGISSCARGVARCD